MTKWEKENPSPKTLAMRRWKKTPAGIAYSKKHNEYVKEWRKKNRDKFKATQKRAQNKARLTVLQHYSSSEIPMCKCCSESEILFLHVDHIKGDGAAHMKLLKETLGYNPTGNGFIYWIIKNNFPDGFQILCANCNLGKRTGAYCPHELKRI